MNMWEHRRTNSKGGTTWKWTWRRDKIYGGEFLWKLKPSTGHVSEADASLHTWTTIPITHTPTVLPAFPCEHIHTDHNPLMFVASISHSVSNWFSQQDEQPAVQPAGKAGNVHKWTTDKKHSEWTVQMIYITLDGRRQRCVVCSLQPHEQLCEAPHGHSEPKY